MRIALISVLVLAAACSESISNTGSSSSSSTGSISWIKDYDEGLKQARDQGKSIMIYFSADW